MSGSIFICASVRNKWRDGDGGKHLNPSTRSTNERRETEETAMGPTQRRGMTLLHLGDATNGAGGATVHG